MECNSLSLVALEAVAMPAARESFSQQLHGTYVQLRGFHLGAAAVAPLDSAISIAQYLSRIRAYQDNYERRPFSVRADLERSLGEIKAGRVAPRSSTAYAILLFQAAARRAPARLATRLYHSGHIRIDFSPRSPRSVRPAQKWVAVRCMRPSPGPDTRQLYTPSVAGVPATGVWGRRPS